MKMLAIDTSTDYLSLAAMRDGKIVARFHRKSRMRHSSLLVPMIAKLLAGAGIKLGDLDCFCISVGPGSFTGLRIGAATVKGLAYSLNKPIIAVPTLDVIAENAKKFRGIICPVLDARKNKVYACLYNSDGKTVKRISEYLLLPVKDLIGKIEKYDNIIFLGDAAEMIDGKGVIHKNWHPRADIAGRLGTGYFKKKMFTAAEELEPMYLYSRECDIKGI